jgi:hypothetical protein
MYYSYVAIEYIATSFSPARTDLALKLLRQSVDANLVIGSPYGNFSEKENFPKFYYTDYLRSLTYWIVGNFFQVSFGFVIISAIETICRKYFQLRKIANRTKHNTFFDIRKRIPDPHYTRLKFLADMIYTCHHRSTAVILLFKYILA